MAEKNEEIHHEMGNPGNGDHGEGWENLAPVIDEDGVIHEMPSDGEAASGRRSNKSTKRSSSASVKSSASGATERIVTMTLSSIDPGRRPNPSTVCEVCPAGVWMAAPREVKCYCRILHMFTWKTTEPTELTHCDGLAIATEREED